MSRIIIEHEGKRYEVEDYKICDAFNGHVRIRFKNGICPRCGCDVFWIDASEAKPVMRDGGAK